MNQKIMKKQTTNEDSKRLITRGCQYFTNGSDGLQLDPKNVRSTKSSVRKAISESEQFLEWHVYCLRIPSQNFFLKVIKI